MRKNVAVVSLVALAMIFTSCSSSRLQNGFSYRPAYQGPDMSGEISNTLPAEATTAPLAEPTEPITAATPPAPAALTEATSPLAPSDAMVLASVARTQAQQHQQEQVNTRTLVRDMATQYAGEKGVSLTQKQWHKLDRYAAKLEKKQQKKAEVNWGPQNNIEIFILAAAGVGLIVGILGGGIGWFVFLVAALAYLFLKLLK